MNRAVGSLVDKNSILYFLLVITPLMDTLNGWYVINHGETGVSIGTFYRMFILLFVFCAYNFTFKSWKWILILAYFPVTAALRGEVEGYSFMSSFTYGLKWMLPGIYILLFAFLVRKGYENIPLKILEVWKCLIPGILIFEYIFNLGTEAYYDAGFKGYFYCNNDIGFSLTMMTIYSLYMFIRVKMNIKSLIPVVLNLIAILILSTKSCLIFCFISVAIFLFKESKKNFDKGFFILLGIVILGIIMTFVMSDNIADIIKRYSDFYKVTASNGNGFADFMGFLTSARTYRISDMFTELSDNFSFFKLLLGWRPTVFYGAIEMDWFDALFQHGVIGFMILFLFYFKTIVNRKYEYLYKYMLVIAMICACFSGHVINGALPSTVFAIVVGAAVNSINSNQRVVYGE